MKFQNLQLEDMSQPVVESWIEKTRGSLQDIGLFPLQRAYGSTFAVL